MTTIGPTPGTVTDALSLPTVSTDTSRVASRANLEAAGRQFEAVFTQMMLKSMRQPHLAEDLFASKARDTFRDMQDQKLAQTMAETAPLGIGKAMVAFLSKAQAGLAPGVDPAAPAESIAP